MISREAMPKQLDQKRYKELFEGSLNRLNGGTIPISQQPILRSRQDRTNSFGADSSEAVIALAANSLAALWQVSPSKRRSL